MIYSYFLPIIGFNISVEPHATQMQNQNRVKTVKSTAEHHVCKTNCLEHFLAFAFHGGAVMAPSLASFQKPDEINVDSALSVEASDPNVLALM